MRLRGNHFKQKETSLISLFLNTIATVESNYFLVDVPLVNVLAAIFQ